MSATYMALRVEYLEQPTSTILHKRPTQANILLVIGLLCRLERIIFLKNFIEIGNVIKYDNIHMVEMIN